MTDLHYCGCSFCAERGTEIDRLRADNAEAEEQISRLNDKAIELLHLREHVKKIEAQLASARKALEEIVKANDDFRSGMPEEWEGDPLQDACEHARKLLSDDEGNGSARIQRVALKTAQGEQK